MSRKRAARCGWGLIRAICARVRWRRRYIGAAKISERHRHRYEVNNGYRDALEKAGFRATGTSPDNSLVEVMELKGHPWFLGCQFHPELKSRPLDCHPLFRGLIRAAVERRTAVTPERSNVRELRTVAS